jgi:hypothetical protein
MINLNPFIWYVNPRFDGLVKNPLSFILQHSYFWAFTYNIL